MTAKVTETKYKFILYASELLHSDGAAKNDSSDGYASWKPTFSQRMKNIKTL